MTPDPRAAWEAEVDKIVSRYVTRDESGMSYYDAEIDGLREAIHVRLLGAWAEGFRAGAEAERKAAAEMVNWALDHLARLARDNAVAKPMATISGGLHGYLAAPLPPLPEGW